ncbi:MAG TPA: S8 family peptidase [Patescibacteria group bacterium]|nr:S8 family peptidase [Patescibacteria group bacterium]
MGIHQKIMWFFAILGLASMQFTFVNATPMQETAERRIVTYHSSHSFQERMRTMQDIRARFVKRLENVSNVEVVELTPTQEAILKLKYKDIVIEPDAIAYTTAETLPWGVNRIDAEKVSPVTSGQSVNVAVLDTGIDLHHPDLRFNIKGQYNAITPYAQAQDGNGHGTHVAGIIAAVANRNGVVGVSPRANIYAVKVLADNGSGYVSDIVEGIEWAKSRGIKVINMSLGTGVDVYALRDAVQRAKAAGITIVAASGNTGGSVSYPAAYSEVIAVGAVDASGNVASWSSRGPEVDIVAPGVNILSTYRYFSYANMSGTSMAAPHVAAVAALLVSYPVNCQNLLDGFAGCSPDEIQKRIEMTAEILAQDSIIEKDSVYGSGMVDAEKAVLNK